MGERASVSEKMLQRIGEEMEGRGGEWDWSAVVRLAAEVKGGLGCIS